MDIKKRVALVTGGAKRVGRAISYELAKHGAKVAVNYKNSQKEADELVVQIHKIGGDAIALKADVSKRDEVNRMVDSVLSTYGHIDILVNNAAIFFKTPFLETTEEDWDLFMSVNLKSAFLCSQKVAKTMLKQGLGKIVNIADAGGGIKGWKNYTPYCVSKAGLIMLTKTMAKALAPNIQVNSVAPGPVAFPEDYTEKEKTRAIESTLLKREGTPDDIARAVLFLAESDYITGEVIVVDGGNMIV